MEEAYKKEIYAKSNYLIGAKYKSTLLENKLTAVSFFKISQNDYREIDEGIVVSIHAQELMKLLKNDKGGSFYTALSETAQLMTGRTIGFSDPENGKFDYISIITRATYENGNLSIIFNKAFRNLITDVKDNYTLLNCATMMSFKSVYSFRLYELLKSKAYISKSDVCKEKPNSFEISFELAELKFLFGSVNANLDRVQKVLRGNGRPDYERALSLAAEKSFENWYDFRRRVLELAVKEINQKSDILIDFTPVKSGKGAKVKAVDFVVTFKESNRKQDEKKSLTEDEKDEVYDFIYEKATELKVKLQMKEARLIAEEAEYDKEKIEKAFSIANGNIDNIVGFLRMAIRQDYKAATPTPAKKKQFQKSYKNSFNDFQQNEYDFAQLEEELRAN